MLNVIIKVFLVVTTPFKQLLLTTAYFPLTYNYQDPLNTNNFGQTSIADFYNWRIYNTLEQVTSTYKMDI